MQTETELIALSLIQLVSAALRDLSEGRPIPLEWRTALEKEIGPRKARGRPKIERVRARNLTIARRMLEQYLAIEHGESGIRITQFAQELANEYGEKGRAFERKDVFRIYGELQWEVMSEEICRRLRADDEARKKARVERAQRIKQRLANGEDFHTILADPSTEIDDYKAIRNHQRTGADLGGPPVEARATDYTSRRQTILRWVNDGMNLGVGHDPVPVANLNAGASAGLLPRLGKRS